MAMAALMTGHCSFHKTFDDFLTKMWLYLTDDALDLGLELRSRFWFIRINPRF